MYRRYPHSSTEDVKETIAILEREEKVKELLLEAINLIGLRGVLYHLSSWVIMQQLIKQQQDQELSDDSKVVSSCLQKAWRFAENPQGVDEL